MPSKTVMNSLSKTITEKGNRIRLKAWGQMTDGQDYKISHEVQ